MRHKWARYVTVAFQALSVVLGMIFVMPDLYEPTLQVPHPFLRWLIFGSYGVRALIVVTMVAGPSMKRLTSRAYE